MQNKLSTLHLFSLIGINLLYACVGVCTKLASQQPTFSWMYIFYFGAAIAVMGVYAVLWQQILKRIELSVAYMFKGTALIFTMLVAALLFGEQITTANILGSAIIILGITLLAKSDDN